MGYVLKNMTLNAMIAALVLISLLVLIGPHKDVNGKSGQPTTTDCAGTTD